MRMPAATILRAAGLFLGLAVASASPAEEPASFTENCGACHQEGGVGAPGFAPRLIDTDIWAHPGPALDRYFAAVVLHGNRAAIVIDGERFQGMMPPQDVLDDAELARIAAYVFDELNGIETALTAEGFAAMRAEPAPNNGTLRAEVLQ